MKVVDTTRLDTAYQQWLSMLPLDETDRHRLSQRFTVEFNYNSNHIEGNTLTYGQTELLLLFGKVMGEAERQATITPVELAALFHYRYIRIHPFEDGNGRIARLLVNYILARHNYPMIVVRSRKKAAYLDALTAADKEVGPSPSKGANATLIQIRHFLSYFTQLVTEELTSHVQFVTEKDPLHWWYDGEMIRLRSPKVSNLLYAIMLHPTITIPQLSTHCDLSERMIKNYLKQFTDQHYIQRAADGKFHIFIVPSAL